MTSTLVTLAAAALTFLVAVGIVAALVGMVMWAVREVGIWHLNRDASDQLRVRESEGELRRMLHGDEISRRVIDAEQSRVVSRTRY